MRTIKSILILSLLASVNLGFGQLKYTSSNMLGINRIPYYPLDVEGTTRLNGYVGINGVPAVGYPLSITSSYGKIIMIDPSLTESVIGSNLDNIHFYYPSTGYNKVYAQSYSIGSDSSLKKNIEPLYQGAIYKVLGLRPVRFEYKNETESSNNNKLKQIGLIAQEVEEIVPEAVSFSEMGNIRMIDYDMLIPVLIKAIQEQQTTIENLSKTIDRMKSDSKQEKSNSLSTNAQVGIPSYLAILEQNAPNPFNQSTRIGYFLPESSIKATMYIYNMNGLQIKSIPITQRGYGYITINASELQPGIYLYTLIVDGSEVNTKRMILTE